jgi:hypothetical protein
MLARAHQMLALGCLMVLVSACSLSSASAPPTAVPVGTVSGKLVNSSDSAVTGKNLMLLHVVDAGGVPRYEPTAYKAGTDANGRFTFDKVEAGKYAIVIDPGDPMKLNMRTMLLRGSDDGYVFDLPATSGIDLGVQRALASS